MSTPPTGEDPQRASGYGQPAYGQQFPPPAYAPPPSGPGPTDQQPGYGPYGGQPPPGWQPGPPPKPPRDRKRTALIAALVVVALAIAAGVALLVYVLSSTILDRTAVEKAVSSQFEEREGVKLALVCRHRMIVRPGADYECEGTTADGEDVEIRIVITDDNGAYTWSED
jgi:hypothetical protein